MTDLINIDNISKIYGKDQGQRVEVLKEFSLVIKNNESLAITGPSGAGKSTLLNIIGGLDSPDMGTVCFEGKNIYSLSSKQLDLYRNHNIGFVFQFHYLLEDFSAIENVMIPALIGGKSYSESYERANELLCKVGLGDRIKHFPKELSGGEQQRVAVSRALMNAPKIILADEPTGSLDKNNSQIVENILLNLKEIGITVVIVTHDNVFASKCDRHIILEKV